MNRHRSAWRVAGRLSRREVRRRPGRAALIALLVAAPVATMTVAAVMVRSNRLTPIQEWRFNGGRADAVLQGDAASLLPAGSRAVAFRSDHPLVRTAEGSRVRAEVTDLPLDDPLTDGIFGLVAGRAPHTAAEVALSRHTARQLGAPVGTVVHLQRPTARTVTVVGIVDRAGWKDGDTVVFSPGTLPATGTSTVDSLLVDLPNTMSGRDVAQWAQSTLAGGKGFSLAPGLAPETFSPAGQTDDGTRVVVWSWVIGAAALTVTGIVIAAAFAAGARRQLTTLGQLNANGASPQVLRRVLFLQGTWTGLGGAVAGLSIGAAVLAGLASHRYQILGRDVGSYRIRPSDVVPPVILGILAATVAALLPARTASRTPVVTALAGRRPLPRVARWLAPTGAVVMGAGLGLLALAILGAKSNRNGDVWTFTGVVGGTAVLLGACAVTPAYVSALDSAASHLRGTWRLAARSLTRQRTRTAAVVAAVSATTALAVAASALLLAADTQRRHRHPYLATNQVQVITTLAGPIAADATQPPAPTPVAAPADIIARLQGVLPGAAVLHLTTLGPPAGTAPHPLLHDFRPDHAGAVQAAGLSTTVDEGIAVVADPDALKAYRLDDRALRALRDTGAVAFGVSGRAQLTMPVTADPGAGGEGEAITVDVLDRSRYPLGGLPPLLLTAGQAQRAGLPTAPTAVVLQTPRPLTATERDNAQGVLDDYNDEHPLQISPTSAPQPSVGVEYFTPDSNLNRSLLNGLLVALALIFSLFVVAANLALAAAETRDERDTLAVLGAAPKTIRRTSGHKALLLSLLGGLFGIPVGLLPVYVFTQIDTGDLPFAIPWAVAAAAVVVIPLAAAWSTNIASAIALRRRPLQISTMTFE